MSLVKQKCCSFFESSEWDGGYKEVGCYIDQEDKWGQLAIGGTVQRFDSKNVLQKCYERALAEGNTHFAVQYNIECYTSSTAYKTYNKYGPGTGCIKGKGGDSVMSVYQLIPGKNFLRGTYKMAQASKE